MSNIFYKNIKRKHLWLINIARSLKESHQTGQMFVTAFALKGNRILAIGCNNYNVQHPRGKFGRYLAAKDRNFEYQPGLHAEIKCIKELGLFRDDYHKIEIFVVRIGNEKELYVRNSCPCMNCQRVLEQYNFKRIEFTTDDQYKIGEIRL